MHYESSVNQCTLCHHLRGLLVITKTSRRSKLPPKRNETKPTAPNGTDYI